jgi:hypothetical protein
MYCGRFGDSIGGVERHSGNTKFYYTLVRTDWLTHDSRDTWDYGSWAAGNRPRPRGGHQAVSKNSKTSIGNLYPQYIDNARTFDCPSGQHWGRAPAFEPNIPDGTFDEVTGELLRPFMLGVMNWSLWRGDYGYDPRIYPSAVSNHVIYGDMDGSCVSEPLGSGYITANHDEGQNVLHVDGHVTWEETNYASNDPNDNIFTEAGILDVTHQEKLSGNEAFILDPNTPGWHADTDSYISDDIMMPRPPGGWPGDDLGLCHWKDGGSYYPSLMPPGADRF